MAAVIVNQILDKYSVFHYINVNVNIMNAIIHPTNEVLEFLGGPQKKKDEVKYRLCNLLEFAEMNGIKLIYNGLTQSFVSVNNFEYQEFLKLKTEKDFVDFMFRNYFMVPEDWNEGELIRKYRKEHEIKLDENYLKNPSQYTILTTTACNARCFYCYEKGVKKKTMTIETADKIADFIIKNYEADEKKRDVSIGWFGGEPLVNIKVIDHICNKLKENGVIFHSNFTSNSYLFNDENADKALNDWNVNNIQVTLDGTERMYNAAKNYVYDKEKNGSPFEIVISNINRLLDRNISISVRMNMDMYNADDMLKLVDVLVEKIPNKNKFGAYCYPLFDGYGISRGVDAQWEVLKKAEEISDKLEKNGLNNQNGIRRGISIHHCMVDGGNEILFAPDGHMGLCEHYTENNFIGHIDKPTEYDWDTVAKFKEQILDRDLCNTCPCFSNCVRLKMCEDLRNCNEPVKWWNRNRLKASMREEYKKFVSNSRNGQQYTTTEILTQLNDISNRLAKIDNRFKDIENRIDNLENKD